MPWRIEGQDGKHCVVRQTDDKVEKCHATRTAAEAHMRALYANEKNMSTRDILKEAIRATYRRFGMEPPESMREDGNRISGVFKDSDGNWLWFGAVSNNFLDDDYPVKEIIAEQAHKDFVAALDDGTYKERTGQDMPVHMVWHVPVPIGVADIVDYDSRGFLIAAGHGFKGEFYDKVYEGLARAPDMAMSHQMPGEFLDRDKEQNHIITAYLSTEFSSLPKSAAANKRTVSAHGMQEKDNMLAIDGKKREGFLEMFGESVVAEFDARLEDMVTEAEGDGIPRKEQTDMSEDLEKQDEVLEEEAIAPVDEEEKANKPPFVEDEEEDEDEDDEEKKDAVVAETGDEAVTMKALREEIVPEIAKGIAEALHPYQQALAKAESTMAELAERLDAVEQSENTRLAEKAAETPIASISAMIGQSVASSEKARLDYKDGDDRELWKAGPEQTKEEVVGGLGLPGLDAQIAGSRTPVSANGQ